MQRPCLPTPPADRALFAANFPRAPFQFRHALDQHPAFQLPALFAAAERINADPKSAARAHFESGTPDRNSWFGSRPEGETLISALAAILAPIQDGSNWVILKRIHEDPTYRAVLDTLIPNLSLLSGVDIARTFYDPTMTIFITSPGRLTPYHMDGETNFLAQIHGTKAAYLYDGTNPAILSTPDLERYWTGKLPKIDYPENLPHGHWQYALAPGNGVFTPATFPTGCKTAPTSPSPCPSTSSVATMKKSPPIAPTTISAASASPQPPRGSPRPRPHQASHLRPPLPGRRSHRQYPQVHPEEVMKPGRPISNSFID